MVCALALLLLTMPPSFSQEAWTVSAYGRPMVLDGRLLSVGGLRGIHRGAVLVGAELDFAQLDRAQHLHAAGTCGLSFPLGTRARFDLLGEMGAHLNLGVATAPFVGAQPALEFLVGERWALGAGLSARVDILQVQVGRFSYGADLHAAMRFQ